ncbi:MAG: TOMM precursor leader peptide-binding protein [Pseudomonadota bacterium]
MDVAPIDRPRFKSFVEPVVDPDDGLILLSEDHHAWMPQSIYAALAPLLDGTRDIEAVFAALADRHSTHAIFAALDDLRTRGYLADGSSATRAGTATSSARAADAFWEQAGVEPSQARRRLADTPVTLSVLGDLDGQRLAELLGAQGVRVAPDGRIQVVLTDDYLRPELHGVNAQSLASGAPWLLVKPVGIETWLGPAFTPGQSACWACLAHRLRWHRRVERYVAARAAGPLRVPQPHTPASQLAALADAATQIALWIGSGRPAPLADRVVSQNALTLARTVHTLVKRPQCPACGVATPADGSAAAPIELTPRAKTNRAAGGHRACGPDGVLAALERHVSPITGLVGTLQQGERAGPQNGRDWVTPTFSADHNFNDINDQRFILREGLRRRSGGKGTTVRQARISALAEALERHCGVYDGTEPTLRATFDELGEAAIHPNAAMGYSARQYAEREARNARAHKAHFVPEPFCRDVPLDWTPLWSLTHAHTRHLPTAICYFGYAGPDPVYGRADSNGCAAGAVLEEAILQGLLELVERDAVAIWWYNRLRRPAVDLASFDGAYHQALTDHYRALGREISVIDVTSDVAIPTFAALSRRTDTPSEDIIYGFGAHLDPNVALTRALTELNQSLEAVPLRGGTGAAQTYLGTDEAIAWWQGVTMAQSPYLVPNPNLAPTQYSTHADLSTDDIAADVALCVARLRSLGIEVLVLDQTRPDVGFPVVRVVAPGLRHFWARFGPGRLYDVPVREGWRAAPAAEADLNPFVIQF